MAFREASLGSNPLARLPRYQNEASLYRETWSRSGESFAVDTGWAGASWLAPTRALVCGKPQLLGSRSDLLCMNQERPGRLSLSCFPIGRYLAGNGAALLSVGPLKKHVDHEIATKNAKC